MSLPELAVPELVAGKFPFPATPKNAVTWGDTTSQSGVDCDPAILADDLE